MRAIIAPADKIVICFAHVAYQLHERFSALETGINSFAVRDLETLVKRVGEADVLVISGLWQNQLLDRTKRLRFIQSIGAGTDQFPREELAPRHPACECPRRRPMPISGPLPARSPKRQKTWSTPRHSAR
jgi:phosphoglycerate dehydrogenase-like enzyme